MILELADDETFRQNFFQRRLSDVADDFRQPHAWRDISEAVDHAGVFMPQAFLTDQRRLAFPLETVFRINPPDLLENLSDLLTSGRSERYSSSLPCGVRHSK